MRKDCGHFMLGEADPADPVPCTSLRRYRLKVVQRRREVSPTKKDENIGDSVARCNDLAAFAIVNS